MNKIKSKHIRLPVNIIDVIEEEAQVYGYKFNDWVKHILTQRAMDIREKEETIVDEGLVRDIIQGRKDYKAGKLTALKSDKDIDTFFENLDK